VASYLGLELGKIKIKRFADGEIYVQVQVSQPALLMLLLLNCVLAGCTLACLLPTWLPRQRCTAAAQPSWHVA
jgi:hypothetical protein